MNICVLTLQCIKNYGSVLQTYATQELLKSFFDDVEFIRFVRMDAMDEHMLDIWTSGCSGASRIVKRILLKPICDKQIRVFHDFLEKYIQQTTDTYYTEFDFQTKQLEKDAYCVGSDQVWNSSWNQGIFRPMYLSFAPEKKMKFAFCSSFGKTHLDADEQKEIRPLLQRLHRISVREDSALDVLDEMGIQDGEHLLDPTMLLPREKWEALCAPRKIKEEYILSYQLNENADFDSFAYKLAKRKNMKLVHIGLTLRAKTKHGKVLMVPEVNEFLSLIRYASYVITDSFHGTAFSLIFNRQLLCIYPERFSTRLDSILRWADIPDRRVTDYQDDTAADRRIDFTEINERMNQERQKGQAFLQSIVQDMKK